MSVILEVRIRKVIQEREYEPLEIVMGTTLELPAENFSSEEDIAEARKGLYLAVEKDLDWALSSWLESHRPEQDDSEKETPAERRRRLAAAMKGDNE